MSRAKRQVLDLLKEPKVMAKTKAFSGILLSAADSQQTFQFTVYSALFRKQLEKPM